METEKKKYKRIMLKLSGEALANDKGFGIDPEVVYRLAGEIKEASDSGIEIAVVVGGGNIWRGLKGSAGGMDRASADYMGMLATVINSVALQDALEKWVLPQECRRLSKCSRLQNLISAAERSDIWKKEESLFLVPVQGIPILLLIRPPLSVPRKLKRMLC